LGFNIYFQGLGETGLLLKVPFSGYIFDVKCLFSEYILEETAVYEGII